MTNFFSSEVPFGIAALLFWGINDFVVKIPVKQLGWKPTLFWTQTIGVVLLFALIPLVANPFSLSWTLIAAMLFSGVVNFVGYAAMYRALNIAPVGVVLGVVNLFPVVSVSLAVLFLGEQISLTQLIGAVLGLCCVTILAHPGRREDRRVHSEAIRFSICSLVFFGTSMFLCGFLAQKTSWFHAAFFIRFGTVLFALSRFRNERQVVHFDHVRRLPLLLLIGIMEVVGLIVFNLGMEMGRISVMTLFVGLAPGVSAILAWLVYKEKLSRKDVVALIGTLVAGVFLSH